MKKIILSIVGLFLGLSSVANADGHANDVTIQLKWVTQTQFAGYYVAQDMGYYKDEGLNVTITPTGIPFLSLKFDISFLDLVKTAF